MEWSELIKTKGKCCCCERPLKDTHYINLIDTDYIMQWEFPRGGNILTGEDYRAAAIVHDDCIDYHTGKLLGKIKFCIETKGEEGKEEIIYHPVSELQKHIEQKPQ